jgi:hypothetical protein
MANEFVQSLIYIVVIGWDDSSLVVADSFVSRDAAQAYARRVGPAKGADWVGLVKRQLFRTDGRYPSGGAAAIHHPDTDRPEIVWERAPRLDRILAGS